MVDSGKTLQAVAEHYQVNRNTVRVYVQKAREGTLAERISPPGRPRRVQIEHEQQLLRQLDTHPDASLGEHACMLLEATGLNITYRTVDRVFRRHRITYKKNAGRQRTE
jgi:transposase